MSKKISLSKSLQTFGMVFILAFMAGFLTNYYDCLPGPEILIPSAPESPADDDSKIKTLPPPAAPDKPETTPHSHEQTALEESMAELQQELDWLHAEHQRIASELKEAVLESWPEGEIALIQQSLDELLADMHDRALRIYEHSARLGELYAASALERIENL